MWQMAFEGANQGCEDDLMHRLGKHLAIGRSQLMSACKCLKDETNRWLKDDRSKSLR